MLRREGIRVGEKRVERLMRLASLQGAHRRRRKGCTIRVPGIEPFADLVGRNFRPEAPDRVWCADIKQIRTGEGWLYLAAVQDLFSRRIVGWSMAAHMRQELVIDALTMAVKARKPASGTIHHSDHGGQFIGLTFGQSCHDAGIAQSMGAVGTCFDNAVAETFFATLTKERLLHDAPADGWATRAQLRSAILKTGGFQQLLRQQPPDSTKPGGGPYHLRLGRAGSELNLPGLQMPGERSEAE